MRSTRSSLGSWGAPPWLRALLGGAERAGLLAWIENRLTTGFAVFLLHGFGIRQHDLAVLAQAGAAAHRIGARVVAHTIQSAS